MPCPGTFGSPGRITSLSFNSALPDTNNNKLTIFLVKDERDGDTASANTLAKC